MAASVVKWPDFSRPPEPLSRAERWVTIAATVIVAVSRIWGRALSPWDWDEVLFSRALDHYDVADHNPHPPGFPLFIASARILAAAGLSNFHALQAIAIAAGVLLVPATVMFARELRLPPRVAITAALFLAFLPNVWFFGETAFSDVPSMVLVLFACGLLLRGAREPRALITGAVVLGIAVAFRTQNLTVGAAPALIAAFYQMRARRFAVVAAAALAAIVVVVASYGGAAYFSGGWQRYARAIDEHQDYITRVDSFRNPLRPPLRHLIDDFFIRPFRAPLVNTVLSVLALISGIASLVRRRWPVLIALAAFGPFAIAAWLILDVMSTSRFSIGYMPLLAILAADGLGIIVSLVRSDTTRAVAMYAAAATVATIMAAWTLPAIVRIREEVSPTMRAVAWVRANVSHDEVIQTDHDTGPFAELYLSDYALKLEVPGTPLAGLDSRRSWFFSEGNASTRGQTFSWPEDRLARIARRRYFQVSVAPVTTSARFGEGWYGEERPDRKTTWRWMGARSITMLPASSQARLSLRMFVPLHVLRGKPTIEITLNGRTIDRFRAAETFVEKSYELEARADGENVLTIATDQTINPARAGAGGDTRDLGLRVDQLDWTAAGTAVR